MAVKYQKGDSTLHRLDARTKLLMFAALTVLAVIILDPIIIALLFLGLYILGANAVDRDELNSNLRVLVVIFLTFALFQILFFTPENAHFLFYLIPGPNWIPVTVEGIVRGFAVFFRFFIVVLSVHLMLYTTPPVDMVLALTRRERQRNTAQDIGITFGLGILLLAVAYLGFTEGIQRIQLNPLPRLVVIMLAAVALGFVIHRVSSHGLPPEMGIALSIGFATVGILSQQTQKITDAQRARGYDVRPRNLIRRVQVLSALLMPIFLATLERSQDIAIAILARGFDYNVAARTYRRQLVFRSPDYIMIAILVFLLLGSLMLSYFHTSNPTEQLVLGLVRN